MAPLKSGTRKPERILTNLLGDPLAVNSRQAVAKRSWGRTPIFCTIRPDLSGRVLTLSRADSAEEPFMEAKAQVECRHSRVHDCGALAARLRDYRGYLLADAASIHSLMVSAGWIVRSPAEPTCVTTSLLGAGERPDSQPRSHRDCRRSPRRRTTMPRAVQRRRPPAVRASQLPS